MQKNIANSETHIVTVDCSVVGSAVLRRRKQVFVNAHFAHNTQDVAEHISRKNPGIGRTARSVPSIGCVCVATAMQWQVVQLMLYADSVLIHETSGAGAKGVQHVDNIAPMTNETLRPLVGTARCAARNGNAICVARSLPVVLQGHFLNIVGAAHLPAGVAVAVDVVARLALAMRRVHSTRDTAPPALRDSSASATCIVGITMQQALPCSAAQKWYCYFLRG